MIKSPLLSPVRCWAKQLDVDNLEQHEQSALDLAFPLFRELDDRHRFGDGTQWFAVQTGLGSKVLYVGRGRERRYAGDRTLGRGRYWTICADSSGFDSGTLVHEIRAYFSYTSRCGIDIFDSTTEMDRIITAHREGRFDYGRVRRIIREFFGSEDYPALILIITPFEMSGKAHLAGLQIGKVNIFLFPLRLAEIEMHKAFDLRLPSAQEWLVRSFLEMELKEGRRRRAENNITLLDDGPLNAFPGLRENTKQEEKETIIIVNGSPPNTFLELLPVLLSSEIGGGQPFLQALGSWLRHHGCEGIVYPSARTDCDAKAQDGLVLSSSGWNIVDFRKTVAPDFKQHIGQILSWDIYLGNKYEAEIQPIPEGGVQLSTRGISNQNYLRFNCQRHYAEEGGMPSLSDLAGGYISFLDLDIH